MCAPAEVLPNDGSMIEVTGTARDPEGIRELRLAARAYPDTGAGAAQTQVFTYNPPYPTERTETARFVNLDLVPLDAEEIPCSGVARDAELQWSATATSGVPILRPYQWDYGVPYNNPSRSGNLPWQVMEDVFGWGEVHNCIGDTCWRTIRARVVYDDIKGLAKDAECFGMSVYSAVWGTHGTAIDDTLTHSGDYGFMSPGNFDWPLCEGNSTTQYCVQRSIERFHAAQFSDEVMNQTTGQYWSELWSAYGLTPFVQDQLPRIARDIAEGRYGVLGMTEEREAGSAGHAVVPWRVIGGRIYVYDPNREETSITPSTDYDNYDHYPYLDVNDTGFIFRWAGNLDRIWNGYLTYSSYDASARNDYDLPHGIDYLLLTFSSAEGELVVQDESGARTGVVEGATVVEIEGSTPIPILGAGEGLRVYVLPLGVDLEFTVHGNADGQYRWAAIAEDVTYAIWGKDIAPGVEDRIDLGLRGDRLGYSLRVRSPRLDDDLSIGIERPMGDGGREIELGSVDTDGPVDLEIYTDGGGDAVVIANRGLTDVSTSVTLRSTESDQLGEYEVQIGALEQVSLGPDWGHLGNGPGISRARAWPTVSPYVIGGLVGAVVVSGLLLGGAVVVALLRRR
jgi:hypothetical protein